MRKLCSFVSLLLFALCAVLMSVMTFSLFIIASSESQMVFGSIPNAGEMMFLCAAVITFSSCIFELQYDSAFIQTALTVKLAST